MTREAMIEMIRKMSAMPDETLDKALAKRCAEFQADSDMQTVLTFLRDLLDEIVYIAGANGFAMAVIRMMLDGHPETEDEKETRRAALAARIGA